MKIGILTHELATNYGGTLQNYALQTILKRMGYEPNTLDYFATNSIKIIILSFLSRLLRRMKGQHIPLRGWMTNKEYKIVSQHTRAFVSNHITTSERFNINNFGDLDKSQFDAIIVGSDQVWRYRDSILHFFLSDFVDVNIPKISYAASFGIDNWNYSGSVTAKCKELIKNFSSISVREQSGINLCEKFLGVTPKLVLDPTMLLEYTDYLSLIANLHLDSNSKILMVYILDKTPQKRELVNEVSRVKGLKVHEIMAKKIFGAIGSSNLQDCVFPKIEDWIAGFANAKYVVTDSFHGTVFAIIFNKPFISIVNEKRGKSRFYSILGILNLQDRLVTGTNGLEQLINNPIDWDDVNYTLSKLRKQSIDFLKESLKLNE